MNHRLRRSASGLARAVVALALAAGAALGATPAVAADAGDAPVRWSVSPADESGPDGRVAAEHTVDPGETISDFFAVRNVSNQEVTFRLTAADGFYTRTGRFDILPSDQESVASGTWITVPDEVTVPGGETVVVPFEVTVPERAEPGDHAAGITASVRSVQADDSGASVGVESRVGFRVLTRVTGDIVPAAALQGERADYTVSWNPLRPGSAAVSFDVVNEGNTRLVAEGFVEVGGQRIAFPAEGESRQELLPGDTRTIFVDVEGVWPLFVVPAHVELQPVVLTMDGATPDIAPLAADALMWAMPWPHLLLLAGAVLIILAVFWNRRRSRRRLDALLADAREEGRQSVAQPVEAS